MQIEDRIKELLACLDHGQTPPVAYDTAWVARLLEIDRPLGGHAMQWLCEHQLPDGSWGSEVPLYYHDRVICTLAAMTALCRFGRRAQDRQQIEGGLEALSILVKGATRRLSAGPWIDTIGFELIVPTLVAEAESLELIHSQGRTILGTLAKHRKEKLAQLKDRLITREITTAFSSEMAGVDHMNLLDADNLPEVNGSIADSPSATAYFALNVCPQDAKALDYLRRVTQDGGAPQLKPFEIFEYVWVLWNLSLACDAGSPFLTWAGPYLDYLQQQYQTRHGLGLSREFSVSDLDDTSTGYDVLTRLGRKVPLAPVLAFEGPGSFFVYHLESGSSSSANIHALGALRQAGYPADHPTVRKIVVFMSIQQGKWAYWFDKWHYSTYYPSAHAVIACAGWIDDMVKPTVAWLISTQRPDGSWGMQIPTAEETALALQALCTWRLAGGKVDSSILLRGVQWLQAHAEPPYPPLWIGKCLYCPDLVVQSAILSAAMLTEQVLGEPIELEITFARNEALTPLKVYKVE